jgi:hypothetical protein
MKIVRGLLTLILSVILLVPAALPAIAAPPSSLTVKLLNPLPTNLAVGQSYTVSIQVESNQPFTTASLQNAVEFPAYLSDTSDVAQSATSAILHLTLTGRRSTAGLPGGSTSATLHVGVRNKGGQLSVTSFPYTVAVH